MLFLQRIASYFALAQLQDFFNTQFENLSFSNLLWNGAPAHRLLAVRERLPEAFDNCIVALQHKIEWPPRSPELSIFFCMEFTMRKVSVFEVFLIRIFLHLDWILWDTEYLSAFSPNAGKYEPEKLRIRTLFTPWLHEISIIRHTTNDYRSFAICVKEFSCSFKSWLQQFS